MKKFTWITAFASGLGILASAGIAHAYQGDLDPTFGSAGISTPALPKSGAAVVARPLADGRVIVAASCPYTIPPTTPGGAFCLFRLDASGGLDTTFGQAGFVFVGDAVFSTLVNAPTAMALQSDGKILVVGQCGSIPKLTSGYFDFCAARFLSEGALDPAFGTAGIVKFNRNAGRDIPAGVVLQSDGKIVIAGTASFDGGNPRFLLARLNADGSIDPSFGTAGVVIGTGFSTFVPGTVWNSMAGVGIQANGRIVVGGTCIANSLSPTSRNFCFVRYNAGGLIDPSFGTLGSVVLDAPGGRTDQAFSFAMQADDRAIIGGYCQYFSSFPPYGVQDYCVARLTESGALDAGFGVSGRLQIPMYNDSQVLAIVVASDGRITFGGRCGNGPTPANPYSWCFARVFGSGALDPGFGAGGKVFPAVTGWVSSLALQGDGKLIVGMGGNFGFSVARLIGAPPTSTSPVISITPSPLADLGSASTGVGSASRSLLVENTGGGAATSLAVAIASGPFVIASNGCGTFLAAGASCTVLAAFTPTEAQAGRVNGSIAVTYAGGTPATTALTAFGINDIFTDAQRFARQQYRDFLGREGDAPGVAAWSALLNGGSVTRAQMIDAFVRSPEFQGVVAPVTRLYLAAFVRIPDYAGLSFWISQYQSGTGLQAISQAFVTSQEFVDRYGALNDTQFVTLVYQNVLGRAPDAGGLAYWVGQLGTQAMTRGQVMTGFSESAEFIATSFSEVYVTMVYTGMLRRSADTSGFAWWVNWLDSGLTGFTLIDGFIASPEYRNRFLP